MKRKLGQRPIQLALFILSILFFMTSCDYLGWARERTEDPGKELARVYEKKLHESALEDLKFQDLSAGDSARLVDNFVKNWIKKELTLQKAKEYLPDDASEIEKQVEEYRESLITFMYERELLASKVNTEVSEEDKAEYYESHKGHFKLKDDIVYCHYFFMKKGFAEVDTVRKHLRNPTDDSAQILQDIGFQFSANFTLDGEWVAYDKLKKKLPRSLGAASENLKRDRLIEMSDSTTVYFIKIDDFGLKGGLAPLSYHKQDINKIIVNKRKEEFLRTAKANLYNQAIKNRKVELYY